MAHIVAAERLWLERLEQRGQTLPVWPDFTIEQSESQANELAFALERFSGRKICCRSLRRNQLYEQQRGKMDQPCG